MSIRLSIEEYEAERKRNSFAVRETPEKIYTYERAPLPKFPPPTLPRAVPAASSYAAAGGNALPQAPQPGAAANQMPTLPRYQAPPRTQAPRGALPVTSAYAAAAGGKPLAALPRVGVAANQMPTLPRAATPPKLAAPSGITDSKNPLLKSFAYGAERVGRGLLGAGEGITDYITSTGNNLLGNVASFGGIVPNPVSKYFEDTAKYSLQDDLSGRYGQSIDRRYRPNDAQRALGGINEAGAAMLPAMAATAVAGPFAGKAVIGTQAGGHSAAQATKEGATLDQALNYGTTSGLLEATIESIAGGIPGLPEGVVTSMVNRLLKSPLAGKVVDILGEGGEEVLSTVLDPFIKRAIYDGNAKGATAEEIAQSAVMGIVMSGIMQGGVGAVNLAGKAADGISRRINAGIDGINLDLAPDVEPVDVITELSDGTLRAKGQADFYGAGRGISPDAEKARRLPMEPISRLPALPPAQGMPRLHTVGESVNETRGIDSNAPYEVTQSGAEYRVGDYLRKLETLKTPAEIADYTRRVDSLLTETEDTRARAVNAYAAYIYGYRGNGVALVPTGEGEQRLRVSQNEPWYGKYAGRPLSRADALALAERVVDSPAMQADFPQVVDPKILDAANGTSILREDLRYLRDHVLTDGLLRVAPAAQGYTAQYGTPPRPLEGGTEFVTPINAVMGGRPDSLPLKGLDAAAQTVHNINGGDLSGNDGTGTHSISSDSSGAILRGEAGRNSVNAGADESQGGFVERTHRAGQSTETVNDIVYAYKPVAPAQYSQTASLVTRELSERGIDCTVIDGALSANSNGRTSVSAGEASTLRNGRVVVRNNASLNPKVISGHEAYHAAATIAPDLAQTYYHSIADGGLNWSNPQLVEYADTIISAYFGKNFDITVDYNKFYNEFAPFVAGNLNVDFDLATDTYSGWFNDWDGVVSAWKAMDNGLKERAQGGGGSAPTAPQKPIEPLYVVNQDVLALGEDSRNAARSIHQAVVSGQAALERMNRAQAKVSGASSIDAATQMVRQAGGVTDYIAEKGAVDRNGNPIGESFVKLMEHIPKGSEDAFNDYAQNLHNIDRSRQGKTVNGNSLQNSRAIVADYERTYPDFRKTIREIEGWWDTVGHEWMVGSGIVSEDAYRLMRKMYPNYVPTFRVGLTEFGGKAYARPKNAVKTPGVVDRATGGVAEIVPLQDAFMMQVDRMVKSAQKNALYNELIGFAFDSPEAAAQAGIVINPNRGSLPPSADASIEDQLQLIDRDALQEVSPGMFTLTAYRDGNPIVAEISRDVWNSLKNLQDGGISGDSINQMLDTFNRVMELPKLAITGANAVFAVRNALRDFPSYFINSVANNPLQLTSSYMRALLDVATKSNLYKQYEAQGGSRSGFYSSRDGLRKSLQGAAPFIQKSLAGKTKSVAAAPFKAMSAIGEFTEKVPRVAEYRNALKKYSDTPEGRRAAQLAAADVTVNFSRTAPVAKLGNSAILYLNAQIQGMDKMARQIKYHPVATMTKAALLITLPKLLLYLLNRDNPNYDKLNDRTKDSYFILPNELGEHDEDGNAKTFFKIPMSREYGALLGASVDRLFCYMETSDAPESFRGFGSTIQNDLAFSNPVTDNFLAPLFINLPNNKDFAGRSIVPQSMVDLSPQYQYDINTSGAARRVADGLHWLPGNDNPLKSPKAIDYLMSSYGGYPAQLVQGFTSPQNVGQKPAETARNAAYRALVQPFERSFTADPRYQSAATDTFYRKYDEAKTAAADRTHLENLNPEVVTPEEKARSAYAALSKQMSALRDEEKQILDLPISGMEKKERTNVLREQMNALAESAPQSAQSAYDEWNAEYVPELSHLSDGLRESARELKPLGVTADVFLAAYNAQKGVTGDKDARGNTIPLSASKKKKAAIDAVTGIISRQARERLYEQFDVSKEVWRWKNR